ncbi:MAG TPA: polysaccharide biosynthesis/export family protein [Usitatibacter sp.]|jgi:polysaccharide export outer membrane protein|nr:polysaccharide biosynthesis/export family protein [Usitatibacter sp.]
MLHHLRFFAGLALVLVAAAAFGQSTDASSYKLGAGDVISIRVLGEDDLKREKVRLSDAGTVSFPVLGELKVKGLTVGDLEQVITRGLKGRYLVNPQVTVTVEEYRNYFVNGQVEKPGGYPYVPGLTVRKAITLAGGFKERAARDKISIIREDDSTNTAHRVTLDAYVHPGDVMTIDESFF